MHYALTDPPASFQRFMNDVFKDMLDVYVVIYLDDILIYSENTDVLCEPPTVESRNSTIRTRTQRDIPENITLKLLVHPKTRKTESNGR